MVNGISKRLIPEKSQTITFPETYFSFGVYREYAAFRTKNDYKAKGLGVMIGFSQYIRDIWSGQIEGRWSDWASKDEARYSDTSPLSLFSKVTASFNRKSNWFHNAYIDSIHPYATGGFGYTFFFDNRSLLAARSKTTVGQISATYGGGVRIILPLSFSIKLGAEEWRGIEDGDYFSNIFYVQLNFGDVDHS
jgi:hypothetical protein